MDAKPLVALPVAPLDLLPVNKGRAGSHQSMVEVATVAAQLRQSAAEAIGGLDA